MSKKKVSQKEADFILCGIAYAHAIHKYDGKTIIPGREMAQFSDEVYEIFDCYCKEYGVKVKKGKNHD